MITASEWEVMRVVWANDTVTSRYMIEVLAQKCDWNASTIKTLLARLVKKGYLTTHKQQRTFLYSATISQQEAIVQKIEGDLAAVCQLQKGDVLLQVLQNITISRNDRKRLIDMLYSGLDSAPEMLTCQCAKGQCRCGH